MRYSALFSAALPVAIFAAVLVIVLHGEVWDWDDIRNLFVVEILTLMLVHFVLANSNPALQRERRIAALLRYYGAQDVADEEALLE